MRDQPADQQGGDLVLDLPEHLLRDLEREGEGPAQDVQRGDRRIARLEGIAAHGVLRRTPAPLSGAGADCGFAADVLDRVAAAGRSRLHDPRRPGDAGERRGAAARHGIGSADLVALFQLARQCAAGRFRPIVPHRPDRAAGGHRAAAGLARTDAAGAGRRTRDRRSPGDRLRGAQRRSVRPLHDRHRLRHAVGADLPVGDPADLSVRGRAALAAGDRLRAVCAKIRWPTCASWCCRR